MDKQPLETFEDILSWQLHILRMLGMECFTEPISVNAHSLSFILLSLLFFVISVYDILGPFRNDLFGKAFVMTTICFAAMGIARILTVLVHRPVTPRLLATVRATYVRGTDDDRQTAILTRYTAIYARGVLLYSSMFLVAAVLAIIGPLFFFLYNGEKVLPFGVYLPFVDPDSGTGYELNYLYQVSCIIWTPPGLTAVQNIYFALILNICIQYDVLQLQLADLNGLILGQVGSPQAVRAKLRGVIVAQRRLERFINTIETVYSVQAFVDVLSLAFQLVLTLYVMLTKLWPPGLGVIPLCFIQLLILCVPGMLIEIKSAKLTETIYGLAWHEMSPPDKRIFQLLLHRSQHPPRLTCAGMATINMNLFISVTKKVYSIFMMLESM